MAKHSKQDIFNVADQLVEIGKSPTLANVREALGGGSFTTISQAMNEWKAKQAADSHTIKEAAPEAVTSRVNALSAETWGIAQVLANARLANEREALEHSRLDSEAAQQEAIDLADQLSAELDTLQTDHDNLINDVKAAHEQLATTTQTNLSLQKQLDTAEIRAEEGNTRLKDLKAELTHCHDEARAHRRQHTQETQQLNDKLATAQQTASDSRAAAARLEGELTQTQAAMQSQLEQHDQHHQQLNQQLADAQHMISDSRDATIRLEGDLKHTQQLNETLIGAQQQTTDDQATMATLKETIKTLKAQQASPKKTK